MVEDDQRFEEAMMLTRDEGSALHDHIISCPIWSPFDAHEAAIVLLAMLESEDHDSQSKFKTI